MGVAKVQRTNRRTENLLTARNELRFNRSPFLTPNGVGRVEDDVGAPIVERLVEGLVGAVDDFRSLSMSATGLAIGRKRVTTDRLKKVGGAAHPHA